MLDLRIVEVFLEARLLSAPAAEPGARVGRSFFGLPWISIVALRASFIAMCGPENPRGKAQCEKRSPFFKPAVSGFPMEDDGRGGTTTPEGGAIGEFAIDLADGASRTIAPARSAAIQ